MERRFGNEAALSRGETGERKWKLASQPRARDLHANSRIVSQHAYLEFQLFELALHDIPDADDPNQGLARDYG